MALQEITHDQFNLDDSWTDPGKYKYYRDVIKMFIDSNGRPMQVIYTRTWGWVKTPYFVHAKEKARG